MSRIPDRKQIEEATEVARSEMKVACQKLQELEGKLLALDVLEGKASWRGNGLYGKKTQFDIVADRLRRGPATLRELVAELQIPSRSMSTVLTELKIHGIVMNDGKKPATWRLCDPNPAGGS